MYEARIEYTAQGVTVGALMGMYGLIEGDGSLIKQFRLPLIVFMAFSIEAYLNRVGAAHISYWDELERLPWKKKAAILHKAAKREADWGSGPLQFASEVFVLRDKLAHGKPELLSQMFSSHEEAINAVMKGLQPAWLERFDDSWVLEAKSRFQALMVYIGELFGLHESDHLSSATGQIFKHT